jgi:hypothetical protein
MGGIINTVTRRGTNSYHGTAYWFFRNRTLEAADRYSHDFALPEWRHQAGATLGGPVQKDKLFFFSNFEVVERNFPGLNEITSTQISDATGLHVNPAKLHDSRDSRAVRGGNRFYPGADRRSGAAHGFFRVGLSEAGLPYQRTQCPHPQLQHYALALAERYSEQCCCISDRRAPRQQRQFHGGNAFR